MLWPAVPQELAPEHKKREFEEHEKQSIMGAVEAKPIESVTDAVRGGQRALQPKTNG